MIDVVELARIKEGLSRIPPERKTNPILIDMQRLVEQVEHDLSNRGPTRVLVESNGKPLFDSTYAKGIATLHVQAEMSEELQERFLRDGGKFRVNVLDRNGGIVHSELETADDAAMRDALERGLAALMALEMTKEQLEYAVSFIRNIGYSHTHLGCDAAIKDIDAIALKHVEAASAK